MDLRKPNSKYRDEVVLAASDDEADPYTVGKHFAVHPALVRFWLRKYPVPENTDVPSKEPEPSSIEKKIDSFDKSVKEFSEQRPFTSALMGLGIISILIVVFILLVGLVITLINPDHTDYREELYNAEPAKPSVSPKSAKIDWRKHEGKVVIWEVIVSNIYTNADRGGIDKLMNFGGFPTIEFHAKKDGVNIAFSTGDLIASDGPLGYERCFKKYKPGSSMRVKGILHRDWDSRETVKDAGSRKFDFLREPKRARVAPAFPISCLEKYIKTNPPIEVQTKCKDYWCNSHFSNCDERKKLCLKKHGWKGE